MTVMSIFLNMISVGAMKTVLKMKTRRRLRLQPSPRRPHLPPQGHPHAQGRLQGQATVQGQTRHPIRIHQGSEAILGQGNGYTGSRFSRSLSFLSF